MSNGSLDYSHLEDREILLLVVQKVDGLDGLPRRISALERKWSWLTGVGAAAGTIMSLGLGWLARKHNG